MQTVLLVGMSVVVVLSFLFAAACYRRRQKAIDEDYNLLLRFFISYIAVACETGPTEQERANAYTSYKRVLNARSYLRHENAFMWARLEDYFA